MRPSYGKVSELMEVNGVRPADVTNALGFKSQAVFSDWKSGKSYPKTDKLVLIARFFGTTVEELMED